MCIIFIDKDALHVKIGCPVSILYTDARTLNLKHRQPFRECWDSEIHMEMQKKTWKKHPRAQKTSQVKE